MDISGIKFPRSVQEILRDYQQGILKGKTREQPGEKRTPAVARRLSEPHKQGTNGSAAQQKEGPCPADRPYVVAERARFASRGARRTVTVGESNR
jgi:hypothetical protein